ncbi:tRNA (adenosine(37)-N6)-threonylcarbamoyltransferase complex dimerization subunit type 1 TsaB [Paenibacillus oryzisoli]|uniref:tRNA (adenosine(37)-N6)-threonylcarbamoyltransferase complex dimerization subunit type 1 TsaB n=1 Tax=Paenibacillus oryzisoli TaxID=1850517 RepID=UPI003D2A25F0
MTEREEIMTERGQTMIRAERLPSTGRCLAIDTSTSAMSVALLEEGKLLGEISSHAERNHSIGLMPHINDLLARFQMTPRDLQSIAVGQGPGSYTGVRIAVSVGKTYAWALGLDLLGVSSLEAMALGSSVRNDAGLDGELTWVIPLMDGRRKQAFTAVYGFQGEGAETGLGRAGWHEVLPDGIRVIGGWLEQVRDQAEQAGVRTLLFVGETAGFAQELEDFAATVSAEVLVRPYGIEAEFIGRLAYPRLLQGEKADVHAFVPNYTRLPEAEANLLAGVQVKKGDR